MTNSEINEQIAIIMGYDYERYEDLILVSLRKSSGNVVSVQGVFNPCVSPADAEPVIEKFKIDSSYNTHDENWYALCEGHLQNDTSRLVACMKAAVSLNMENNNV
jgi:hypothetical protein